MSTSEVANIMAELDFVHDVNVYGVKVPGRLCVASSSVRHIFLSFAILALCPYGYLHWPLASVLELRGRAFAHGAMGRRIDPSWGGPTKLFLVPASAPRLV